MFTLWSGSKIKSLFRGAPRWRRASRPRGLRPRLEVLEDRLAPATHIWIGGDMSRVDGDVQAPPTVRLPRSPGATP
jgi:hypothetical protein